MKTKHFLLWALAVVLNISLFSCQTKQSESNTNLANEIVNIIKQVNNATNDSTITDFTISVIDSDDIENIQMIPPADPSQRYVINIYTESSDSDDHSIFDDSLIAIIAVIFIFGTPIFIAIIICICIVKVKKNNGKVAIMAMEKGFAYPAGNKNTLSDKLQSGIKMVAWSVGIFAFFMIVDAASVAVLALIPFIIGLGRLYAYYRDSRKVSDTSDDSTNFPPVPPVNINKDNSADNDAL